MWDIISLANLPTIHLRKISLYSILETAGLDNTFIDDYLLMCVKEPTLERLYLSAALKDITELLSEENLELDYWAITHELNMLVKEVRYVCLRYSPKHHRLVNLYVEFPNTVMLGFRA